VLVEDFLIESAARRPSKVALVCGAQRLTYADLESQSNRLAQALVARGVQRGDRVVVQLPNSPEAVVAIFAALKAGAMFVPLNAGAKQDKVSYVLHDCRATALLAEWPEDQAPQTPWLKAVIRGADLRATLAQYPDRRPDPVNTEQDLACLIYTSGSTGRPKGVMCEHRHVDFASGSIIQYLENRETDIILNALPLSFDYGLYQLLMTFRFGGTLVLENSFAFPSVILSQIASERVTGLPGVPTFYALLLGMDLEAFDLSSLRYLTNTAAALPPNRVIELKHKFPQARLYSMYGLTETKRTLYLPPAELERRPGSVGIPIPGTEAWVEDTHGRRLGPGETGELVVRGPHVMRGYWEDREATAERFRPGPLPDERLCYTGDLFRQDADGFFYFVGRTDDIIKSRGEKIAPKEIENVLHMLPGVVEAAVIGVADPVLGQAVKAFVTCRDGELTPRAVLAHCRAHLEGFMVPKEIEFCEILPKNASGKIDKLKLSISS
jgi:long-chain acyl-CoA synthetase